MPDGTTFKADLASWNFMANGYYDFALTWGKPYVGVGIGASRNWVDDLSITRGGVTAIKEPGGHTWQFAWAVMAGVGVPISSTLTLDLCVRYVDLGSLQTNPGTVTLGTTQVGVYGGATGNLRAWELAVALRF